MLLETVKIYVLTFMLWRFISKTDDNAMDQLSFTENLYVAMSDICRSIADLHETTENDEAELQDSVYVMYIKNNHVMWYPINYRYAKVEDTFMNLFLKLKSLMQNETDDGRRLLNESNNQNDLKLWLPTCDKLVQHDENGTKWINESSLQRSYKEETEPDEIYGKSKKPKEIMFDWFSKNNTLVTQPDNLSDQYLTNIYTKESDHEINRKKRIIKASDKIYEKSINPNEIVFGKFPIKLPLVKEPDVLANSGTINESDHEIYRYERNGQEETEREKIHEKSSKPMDIPTKYTATGQADNLADPIKSVHETNLYKSNEPLVCSDNSNFNISPLNESADNENDVKLDAKDQTSDSLHAEVNLMNWYPVNETHIVVKRPEINVTRETKIIIHGYKAKPTDPFTFRLAYTLHLQNMYNVLLFDAEKLLSNHYFKAVHKARLLGKAIADCIIYWESFGADAADFHLLGISLGAHVAGWAGMYFRRAEGRLIGRITGLDPAGPCFAYVPEDERLDKSDATYVDVIHTNILMQGMFEPTGHSDFFVNGGGPRQPGCFFPSCSHLRSAHLYTESIKHPGRFLSVECDSWSQFQENNCSGKTVLMGYGVTPHVCGQYYLRTSSDNPFGLGESGIKPDN